MNKIDAAKEWLDHKFRGTTICEDHPLTVIYESLQAMKETCSKNGEFLTHQENTLKECTYGDKGVMDALEALDFLSLKVNGYKNAKDIIYAALQAKQPDMERLKRVEEALVSSIIELENFCTGNMTWERLNQALTDIRAMMEGE